MVKPIPDGYSSVTPYLIFEDAAAAIDSYRRACGAIKLVRFPMDGGIAHAELPIGNSRVMLADQQPEMQAFSPGHYGGSPTSLLLSLPAVDSIAENAVAAGAEIVRPVQNQFYGDRSEVFRDPFGYRWTHSTHVEDVTSEEMNQRLAAMSTAAS